MPTILKSILESKREEVIAQKKKYSLEDVVENLKKAPRIRPFKTALLEKVEQGLPAVIAEIKKVHLVKEFYVKGLSLKILL